MTRRTGTVLLFLFTLMAAGCAAGASGEQLVAEAPELTRGAARLEEPVSEATANPAASAPALVDEATVAPLTAAAIAECPVSLPNLEESPNEYYISTQSGYGNAARTMFIGLWPGGKVLFHPDGPGSQPPDGVLGMKFWFYRTVPGDVVIGGERLDAPAPPMEETVLRGEEDGYGETGFHPAGLLFPSEGCWEVTARVGEEEMRVIMLVARLPFAPLQVTWAPAGMAPVDSDLSDYPLAVREVYGQENGEAGRLIVETSRHPRDVMGPYPQTVSEAMVIDGHSGACVRGMAGEVGAWQAEADAAALIWRDAGMATRYRIEQQGLGLACGDLLRVAELTASSPAAVGTGEEAVGPPLAADCPVTQPAEPPGASPEAFADRFWHGSEALYLALPRDGAWAQLAHGEKVFWWSANYAGEPQPEMTIYAHRLDDPSQSLAQSGATNASHPSFPATAMLHGLKLPSHGCWKITGEYKGEGVSFVVWVP